MCNAPDKLRELFASRGLRCTQQRVDVYQALRGTTSHPTAEELHRIVNGNCCPGTSLATVYNTLEALERAGLARAISSSSGGKRYDAATDEHIHVICADGSVKDVPHELSRPMIEALPPHLIADVESALGLSIDRVEVQLFARN